MLLQHAPHPFSQLLKHIYAMVCYPHNPQLTFTVVSISNVYQNLSRTDNVCLSASVDKSVMLHVKKVAVFSNSIVKYAFALIPSQHTLVSNICPCPHLSSTLCQSPSVLERRSFSSRFLDQCNRAHMHTTEFSWVASQALPQAAAVMQVESQKASNPDLGE